MCPPNLRLVKLKNRIICGSFVIIVEFLFSFVMFIAPQIVSKHLRNLLTCFRLSSLMAPLKQVKIAYNKAVLAVKQGVKVILALLTVLHKVIEKRPHLLRMNRF